MRSPLGRKPRDVDCESSADHNCSSMRFYPGQPYIALPSSNSNDDEFHAYVKKATPILSKLTFGSLVGYCSGAAAKKIGKALAVMVGMGFIAIQGFVYTGYVSVDWKKVQNDAIKAIDTTGDGKVTTDDVKVYWKKLKALLTNGIPSASGFTMGFLYGLAG